MKLEKEDFNFLKDIVKDVFTEFETERQNKDFERKTFTTQETAEQIGRSYNHVSNLVKRGILQTTADGKFISGYEINRYLRINNEKTAPSETEAV